LFFNGNTFADIARQVATAIFADLPPIRRREVISALAHYVAGVLSKEDMASIVDSLWKSANFAPSDRVTTLRCSLRCSLSGEVMAILDDGRIKWCSDSGEVLVALPESLIRDG